MSDMLSTLPSPARYFPLEKGLYEVAPNLRVLGTPFGNGDRDKLVFQLDAEFPKYRTNKLECRAERLGKYYAAHDYTPAVEKAVVTFMVERLTREYPQYFVKTPDSDGAFVLECRLTGEKLEIDRESKLVGARGSGPTPPYISAFDALCSQIQEDVAITSTDAEKRNWISSIHLCSPAHWSAESKVGKDFVAVHAPVAGIERMNRTAGALVEASIRKGPYTRFVWGFATDFRLNHHPEPPPGADPRQWHGRSFDAARPKSPFVLRLERQVLVGLPAVDASFFAIRTYFLDGDEIRANAREKDLLRAGLLSMTPESLAYKGLAECRDEVVAWLA